MDEQRAGLESGGSPSRDNGQALGLILIAVGMIAAVAIAMVAVGVRMIHRSAAQTAADAAALAGVAAGRTSAADLAERNGGHLLSFDERTTAGGITVLVVVKVHGEVARASASDAP